MKKKIAIPTKKGKLCKEISAETTFSLFELENEKVVRAEQENIKKSNPFYTSVWLYCKNVTELYMDEISEELKKYLTILGIRVKTKNELSDDDFFNRFVFD